MAEKAAPLAVFSGSNQRFPEIPWAHNIAMPKDLFLFTAPNSVAAWSPVDDRVMGGSSTSNLRHDPVGHAIFEGTVRPENNGGFASVRTLPMDLSAKGASAYVLRVSSDGKRYKFNLRMEDNLEGLTYQSAFVIPGGIWTSVHLPVSQFKATFRGRLVPGAPSLDPVLVRQAGFVIADQQMGNFSLKVQAIGTL